MLKDGPYPWSVKQRVLSRVGHLSNDATAEFLMRDYDGGAHTIVLGHLSEHNNLPELARQKLPVLSLSVVATALSTGIVAVLVHLLFPLAGIPLPWLSALLFGALISPTDPIAVLDMLRRVGAPAALESQLAGESLFNDGVGAVIF